MIRIISGTVLAFLVLLTTVVKADDVGGVVTEVDGKTITIKIGAHFLLEDGHRIEVYVDVPDVGAAVVADAVVTGLDGEIATARIIKSTGKVRTGQKVRGVEEEGELEPTPPVESLPVPPMEPEPPLSPEPPSESPTDEPRREAAPRAACGACRKGLSGGFRSRHGPPPRTGGWLVVDLWYSRHGLTSGRTR